MSLPLSEDVLRGAFAGRIAAVRPRIVHRLALLFVSVALVTLPLIYVALIVGVCVLAYLHAVHNTWIVGGGGLFIALARLAVYAGPLVGAAAVVFFMLKPFWARPARQAAPLLVTRAEAPLLFVFVDLVGKAVRAPVPREIRLDLAVNASAGFRRGLTSLFLPADLVLTLGLPLLHGLTLRQLAGVLAHELGHFSQGGDMRLSYLIRRTNAWFYRVAFEGDQWDRQLAEAGKNQDWRIALILLMVRAMVWLTRKVLVLFALAAHALSAFSMRQAELQADRYEARLTGSATFEGTILRMSELLRGHAMAMVASHHSWLDGRLCEDLPALAVALAARAAGETSGLSGEVPSASLFDTHPPDATRIANAQRERAAGLFSLQGESAALVPPLGEFSRQATAAHYKVDLKLFVAPQQLLSVAAFLGRQGDLAAERKAALRYFGPGFHLMQPLAAGNLKADGMDLASCLEIIREAPRAVLSLQPASPESAEAEPSAPLRYLLQERLQACLGLLASADIRRRLESPDAMADELRKMLALLSGLEAQLPTVTTLVRSLPQAEMIINSAGQGVLPEDVEQQFMQQMGVLHGYAEQLIAQAQSVPYPFEAPGAPSSVATYLAKDPPGMVGALYEFVRTQEILSRIGGLYARALGRIAWHAEQVERVATEHAAQAEGGLLPGQPAPT